MYIAVGQYFHRDRPVAPSGGSQNLPKANLAKANVSTKNLTKTKLTTEKVRGSKLAAGRIYLGTKNQDKKEENSAMKAS